jgi:hypothetical protein
MGSTFRLSWPEDGQSCILYAGPGTKNARKSGTIFLSFDEGKSWSKKRRIYPRGYAYSCLTKLDDGTVGVIFEADGYERIVFTNVTLEWLMQDEVDEPEFSYPGKSKSFFKEDTVVISQKNNQQIRYTTDGSIPDVTSKLYVNPLIIKTSTVIKAKAFSNDGIGSFVSNLELFKSKYPPPKYLIPYNKKYPASGALALIDTKHGTIEFNDGAWQGFEGTDLDIIVDLGKQIAVQKVSAAFLQDLSNWIFFPEFLTLYASTDSDQFKKVGETKTSDPIKRSTLLINPYSVELDSSFIQYIRVKAKNIGVCPEWHQGAGGKAWLFVDEIIVH